MQTRLFLSQFAKIYRTKQQFLHLAHYRHDKNDTEHNISQHQQVQREHDDSDRLY